MHAILLGKALLLFTVLAWAADPSPASLGEALQNPGYQEKPAWFKESFLDIREDLAESTAADKRLILYFYQDGCPYCAKLLNEGLADQAIGTQARVRFDWVSINIWGDREVTGFNGEPITEKQFAAGLKVQFTPTLLLLDEGGAPILRINGYHPPEQLGAALAFVAERRDQVGETFTDFLAARNPQKAKGKLHQEGGFLPHPLRLAENRDLSKRPLVVMFEQANCLGCDELHDSILRREPVAYSLSAFDAAIVDTFSTTPVQTPDGREIPSREWAAELGIRYTPSLVLFDQAGQEVFRTEGYFKSFHVHGALDYVATGAYLHQPSFQRYLASRRAALEERGIKVDLME